MPYPEIGGDTRIRITTNNSFVNPKVGDIWTIKLGRNIEAGDFSMTQTRNGTPTNLTLVGMTHTVDANDIPPGGGSWPLLARAINLNLVSTSINVINNVIDSTNRSGSIISANMASAGVANTFTLQREASTAPNFLWDEVACQLRTTANVATPLRVSFSPTAQNTKTLPVDAAGAALIMQQFTWGGSTAGTTTSGSSGTLGQTDFIEGRSPVSDYMSAAAFKPIQRTDIPGGPLLYQARVQGLPSYFSAVEAVSTNANPFTRTEPGFFAGNRSGDFLLTPNGTMPTMPENGFCVGVDFLFKYKGKPVRSKGIVQCGDSIDRGWKAPTAVPTVGGNINGFLVRTVADLNASGKPTTMTCFAVAGNKAQMSLNRLYSALLGGGQGIDIIIAKPWSTNNVGDGTAGATDCQNLTNLCETQAANLGIPFVFQRPHAGQSNASAACIQIQAYLDAKQAAGKLVWDPRPVMNVSGSQTDLKPEFLTRDINGNVVDITHINSDGDVALFGSCKTFLTANALV